MFDEIEVNIWMACFAYNATFTKLKMYWLYFGVFFLGGGGREQFDSKIS